MALFKSKQIPPTSYGYQAPPGATTHGWSCTNRDCSHSEHEPVRRWPHPCSSCGSPTDPLFDEPWAHDGRGVELQYNLANFPDRDGGFSAMEWPTWEYKEATRRGDVQGAQKGRLDARAVEEVRSADSWWNPGFLYFQMVWWELDAGDLDSAAEDLVHWLSITRTDDVENDNTNRTNSRQVIDMSIRFFDAPGGTMHPQAPQIKAAALEVAAAAYSVLSADVQDGVNRLSRS